MSNRKKTIRILSTLVLIALLWLTFGIIRGIFERKISHHELYIPENAESVLEIKSEELIRSFLEGVLAEGTLDERFNEFVRPSEDSSEPLGIDYFGNCYIFTFKKDEKAFTGILINVTNEDQFRKVMDTETGTGFGYFVRDGVGMMLFQDDGKPESFKSLSILAEDLIKTPCKFDRSVLSPVKDDSQVIYWSKEYSFNEKKTFKNLHLSLAVKKNKLSIEGYADFQSSQERTFPVLEKSDLSIQTQFIPNQLNTLWMNNMKNLGLPFPKLTYINGNYHYSEPSPIKEMKVLPNFDGIYAFEKNFQIRIPLIALSASRKINSLNLQSFKVGDKKIYYKQIDQKTVYLGQSKYRLREPQSSNNQKNALLEVNGDLKQLLEIRNGGIVERLLKLAPEYNAAERFLSNIKASNVYIRDKDGSKVDLLGDITFKKGESALNETIILLMDLGYFD
ncbi:MAG: hypothetical protein AB8B56_12465 [Crocinitomicaceae bacterium]